MKLHIPRNASPKKGTHRRLELERVDPLEQRVAAVDEARQPLAHEELDDGRPPAAVHPEARHLRRLQRLARQVEHARLRLVVVADVGEHALAHLLELY